MQGHVTTIGTPGYAPPEQYQGKPEPRSDLYALGALMHHAMTGRDPTLQPPFSFPPLETLRPDLNLAIARTVNSALSYKIEGRPRNVSAFRQMLLKGRTKESVQTATRRVSSGTAKELSAVHPSGIGPVLNRPQPLPTCTCGAHFYSKNSRWCTKCGRRLFPDSSTSDVL